MEALSTSPFCSWQNWRKAYFKFLIKILSCCVRSPDGIPQGSWMGFWLNYNWPDCVNISFKCCELKTAINNNLNNKKHYFTFNPLLPQLIQITCLVTGKKKKKKRTKPTQKQRAKQESLYGNRRRLQPSPLKPETLCLEMMTVYKTLLQNCPYEAWLCSWSAIYSISHTNLGFCPISPKVISVYLLVRVPGWIIDVS